MAVRRWSELGRARAAVVLGAAAVAALGPAARAEAATRGAQKPPIETRLGGIAPEVLARAGDWEGVLREARVLGAFAPPGSDEWFESRYWIVFAHAKRGEFEALEPVARAALAQGARALGAPPWVERLPAARPSIRTAAQLFEIGSALAHSLQAKELHAEALGHLRLLEADTRGHLKHVLPPETVAMVRLDAGRSFTALGYWNEARAALQSVLSGLPSTAAAPLAAIHLAALPGSGGSYRGRFLREPRLAQVAKELPAAHERARERLARILDVEVEEIPRVVLGLADVPGPFDQLWAYTHFDPRRPGLPPATVLVSSAFAAGRAELEPTLVHELAHAWLWTRLGLAHESLPPWLGEGLAQALCSELDANAWRIVAAVLADDSLDATATDFWEHHGLDYGSDTPGHQPTGSAPLQVLLLADAEDGTGVRRFVELAASGADWRDALVAASGASDLAEYRRAARELAQAAVEERWRIARPRVATLRAARDEGPEEWLDAAEQLLIDPIDPAGEALALAARAEALAEAGRFAEAESAWKELARPRHDNLVDRAHFGRAAALARLGREEEAGALFDLVRASALRPADREAAARALAELRARSAGTRSAPPPTQELREEGASRERRE